MSTANAPNAGPVTALPLAPCVEFVAYPRSAIAASAAREWPDMPGQTLRDAAGRPTVLHFAPNRWLVPTPLPSLLLQLTALERSACGMLLEVEGKWQEVRIQAAHTRRILASGIDVETILKSRDCAAVVLFDCPAILARHEETFHLWIAASFAQSFIEVTAALPDPRPS